jgi:hypothetical protein
MRTARHFGRAPRGVLACLALWLSGCASSQRVAQHFFAVPGLDAEHLRLPGRTEFRPGEAVILVAGGEGFDGRVVRPQLFRVGTVKPMYVGQPIAMTAADIQWWSLGTLEPGKYFAQLQIDERIATDPLLISVIP